MFDFVDYNICAEEPGLCLNSPTCEQMWISARCHCADRYQGDRCEHCAEDYYGDDCGNGFRVKAHESEAQPHAHLNGN